MPCISRHRQRLSSIFKATFSFSTIVKNISYPGGKRFLPWWKMIFTLVRQYFTAYERIESKEGAPLRLTFYL